MFTAAIISLLMFASAPPASAGLLDDLLGGVLGGSGSDEGPVILDIGEGGIAVGTNLGILPDLGLEIGGISNPGVGLTIGNDDDPVSVSADVKVESDSVSVDADLTTPAASAGVEVDLDPHEGINADASAQVSDAASVGVQASVQPSDSGIAVDAGAQADLGEVAAVNSSVAATASSSGIGAAADTCVNVLSSPTDCELGSELLPGPLSELLGLLDQVLPGLAPSLEAHLGGLPLGLCARVRLGNVELPECRSLVSVTDPSDDPGPGNGGPGTPPVSTNPPSQSESSDSDTGTDDSLGNGDDAPRDNPEEAAAADPGGRGGSGLLPRTGGGVSAIAVGLTLLGAGVLIRQIARDRPTLD